MSKSIISTQVPDFVAEWLNERAAQGMVTKSAIIRQVLAQAARRDEPLMMFSKPAEVSAEVEQ
jgi:uncharacterized Zn finger protein